MTVRYQFPKNWLGPDAAEDRLPAASHVRNYDILATCLLADRGEPVPGAECYIDDRLVCRINSFGCKGAEPGPGPAIGVFGDSTAFGWCISPTSWPQMMDLPGLQAVNAGVPGHRLDQIAARYQGLAPALSAQGIDLKAVVVMGGWNDLWGAFDPKALVPSLLAISGPSLIIHTGAFTCISGALGRRGVEGLQARGWNFGFGNQPNAETMAAIRLRVETYNSLLQQLCAQSGRIYVDLDPLLQAPDDQGIAELWADCVHLRLPGQQIVARAVETVLRERLGV